MGFVRNTNEGINEKQLQQVFIDRMSEFYKCGGIRLMMESEKDDFIRLLRNLRGGITQIVKRHAVVNIDNTQQASAGNAQANTAICYLDANNLYGGAMHRMMHYELVDIEDREQVMKEANRIRTCG